MGTAPTIPRPALKRRRHLLLAGAVGFGLIAGPLVAIAPAQAVTATTHTEVGLYGTTDPTYDGVFRQSLAILGLHAAGRAPRPEAVLWLLRQQCRDGGFSSYNPNTRTNCPAYSGTTFSGGEDTNATALAVQALNAVGATRQATRAANWLRSLQLPDGGWEYTAKSGFGSDPNSTGLVLTALSSARVRPALNVLGYLRHLQVGRGHFATTAAADRGGFATPYSNGAPDVLATVQVIPGLRGANLTRTLPLRGWVTTATPPASEPAPSVPGITNWAASWLSLPTTTISGSNASWAVLSWSWDRTGRTAAVKLYNSVIHGKVPATNPGANGLAALASSALGRSADTLAYAAAIARSLQRDTTPPAVTLVVPAAPTAASSWRILRFRAADASSGVQLVFLSASEKRGGVWYQYNGRHWLKLRHGQHRIWIAAILYHGTWVRRLRGLTTGTLSIVYAAVDGTGNVTAHRVAARLTH